MKHLKILFLLFFISTSFVAYASSTAKQLASFDVVSSVWESSAWNQVHSELCAELFPDLSSEVLSAYKQWEVRNREIIDSAWELSHLTNVQAPAVKARIKQMVQKSDFYKRKNSCQTLIITLKLDDYKRNHPEKHKIVTETALAKPIDWPPMKPLAKYLSENLGNIIVSTNALDAPSPTSKYFHDRYKLITLDGYKLLVEKKAELKTIANNVKKSINSLSSFLSKSKSKSTAEGREISALSLETSMLLPGYVKDCNLPLDYSSDVIRGIKLSGKLVFTDKRSYCESLAYILASNNLSVSIKGSRLVVTRM